MSASITAAMELSEFLSDKNTRARPSRSNITPESLRVNNRAICEASAGCDLISIFVAGF